jgi:hypothetical protein
MTVALVLGPVQFEGFEVPREIPFGGAQTLVVKKLVGGDRVIDAMGRDDVDIRWSGRFRGALAEPRARALDQLRIAGQQQLLTWSSLRYLVLIERFEASFEQPFEIPYSISCTVLQDLASPILAVPVDVTSQINADFNAAAAIQAAINVPSIGTSLAATTMAAGAITDFQGVSSVQTATVQAPLAQTQTAVGTQIASQNDVVAASGTVAGVVSGGNPATLAATLSAQSAAFSQLGQLYQLQSVLGRAAVNITNAGS